MSLIPQGAWDRYKGAINSVHDDFNQDILTWIKGRTDVKLFNEQDELGGETVDLKVLIGYNYFRTWPITQREQGGELDNQNMLVLINKKYLTDLGYVTTKGYFNFRPDSDFFMHRGIKYKCEGDSFNSQAKDDPLHFHLILRREEVLVGDEKFDQTVEQSTIAEADVDIIEVIDADDLQ